METLHYQETVLLLILKALKNLSRGEQRLKLREDDTALSLSKAKRPSSSMFGLRGEDRYSFASEGLKKGNIVFTFDMDLFASTAYRNALFERGNTRHGEESSRYRKSIPTTILDDEDNVPKSPQVYGTNAAVTERTAMLQIGPVRPPLLSVAPISAQHKDVSEGTLGVKDQTKITVARDHDKSVAEPFTQWPWHPVAARVYGRALRDYNAKDPHRVSFRVGDHIRFNDKPVHGVLCDGILNGTRGLVLVEYFAHVAESTTVFKKAHCINRWADSDEFTLTEQEVSQALKNKADAS
ncbi:hypothetical protein CC86DRAFT_368409 [Ophiobolus disseminans]|uniref:Uncharacterized protein n=1 Tax=Ophiobolus disseminans TaxID=1469910 RepID=A0A6A7A7X7_9PLEO|nr:hypothetical protein CC86DRAFT_368409 [Ophiobolus disseminans]